MKKLLSALLVLQLAVPYSALAQSASTELSRLQNVLDSASNKTIEMENIFSQSATRTMTQAQLLGQIAVLSQFHAVLSRHIAMANALGGSQMASLVINGGAETLLAFLSADGVGRLVISPMKVEAKDIVKKSATEAVKDAGKTAAKTAEIGAFRKVAIGMGQLGLVVVVVYSLADVARFAQITVKYKTLDDVKALRLRVFAQIQGLEAELSALK
jgi:hypothetical protein